jgi:hypothetical protein
MGGSGEFLPTGSYDPVRWIDEIVIGQHVGFHLVGRVPDLVQYVSKVLLPEIEIQV